MTSGTDSTAQDQAVKVGNPMIYNMPAPASFATGSQSYSAANVIGGIIVHNTGGAGVNGTLPTAAALLAALAANGCPMRVGDTIECLIVNGGTTGSITLLAPNGQVTFDTNQAAGSQVIATLSSKFVQLRFTNVTIGAEAYTVYS